MNVEFFVTMSIALALAYLACIAGAAIVAALRAGGRQEDAVASHQALSVSRFTIPVSVILPVFGDSLSVSQTIASLLGLNYPEFEVVAVVDGAPSPIVDSLALDWGLDAKEFFYRRRLDTAVVRRIYRSARDPRLMVIDKAAGGYGDALNCGVNVARYRYVMSIVPDVTFDADALLRLMSAALRDPANIVGAGSHVERASYPETEGRAAADAQGIVGRVGALFQRLGSLRSLMDSRLAWRHLGSGLGPSDVVAVWRRDAVLERRGFSTTAADANLDMMFRLQASVRERTGRFDRGSDVFGRVGAQSLSGALGTAARRQRATLHVLWMCVRGGAWFIEPRTLAYFVGSELLMPLAQAWVVVATIAGATFGWFGWGVPGLALLLLSFGNASVSVAALFLRGARPGAPEEPELQRLLLAGPLEFVLYRPALAGARLAAAVASVFGRS